MNLIFINIKALNLIVKINVLSIVYFSRIITKKMNTLHMIIVGRDGIKKLGTVNGILNF